jgi:hypothetical protein
VRDIGERAPVRRVVALARPAEFRPPAAEAMLELVREKSAAWKR